MKHTTIAVITVCCALWLAACNTMEGFGKDMRKTGEKIEGAAVRKK